MRRAPTGSGAAGPAARRHLRLRPPRESPRRPMRRPGPAALRLRTGRRARSARAVRRPEATPTRPCRRTTVRKKASRRRCRRISSGRSSIIRRPSRPARSSSIRRTPILYLVLGDGKAMRYGIGVGREGFTWSGAERVTQDGGMAGLASADGNDRAPALPAAFHGGRREQSARRARALSRQDRSIASTAPTSRRRSGRSCRPAASA